MDGKKDDGGPAFPLPENIMVRHFDANGDMTGSTESIAGDTEDGAHFGMSLRDYFAAKAMAGAIAHGLFNAEKGSQGYADYVANIAYIYADAMLEARK